MGSRGDLARYAALIDGLIIRPPVFVPEAEAETAVQVERGVVYPQALKSQALLANTPLDRLLDLAQTGRADSATILDCHGHRRPFYRGLLICAWARAIQLAGTALSADALRVHREAIRGWCAPLEQEVRSIGWGGGLAASQGQGIAAGCWSALGLQVAGQVLGYAPWQSLAGRVFAGLVQSQQGNGAFLQAGASDNPETYWYQELVILHAAGSYAADSGEGAILSGIGRNAEYHLNETQPDHATTQPLAVFAFAVNRSTQLLADQILHAVQIQHPGGAGGMAAILLADGMWCLGRVGG